MVCIFKVRWERRIKDNSVTVGFMLPSSTHSQHNEAVAFAGVPACLWPESPWGRGWGHGLLLLEFMQKIASDGSPRTGDTWDPNWTPMHVYQEKLCATQTGDLPFLLDTHSPWWSWMFVSSGIYRNTGMLISISIGMHTTTHFLCSCTELWSKLLLLYFISSVCKVFVFTLLHFSVLLLPGVCMNY